MCGSVLINLSFSVVEDVTKTAKEIDGLSHNKEEEMLVVFFEQVLKDYYKFLDYG